MMSRGAFWCEPEDGEPFWWPYCEIAGCPNGICFGKGETRFCWPHSGSGKSVGEIIAENNAARSKSLKTPLGADR